MDLAEAEAMHIEAKRLYWKEKNLPAAVDLLLVGAAECMEAAKGGEDKALDLLGEAKGMCYDAASFCWPGWDEPGVAIDDMYLGFGRSMAVENLRLALELERGAGPLGTAHWMVGAYQLVDRNWPAAIESFGRSADLYRAAQDGEMMALAAGYLALAAVLSGQVEGDTSLQTILDRLSPPLRGQLETARTVFSPK